MCCRSSQPVLLSGGLVPVLVECSLGENSLGECSLAGRSWEMQQKKPHSPHSQRASDQRCSGR